MQHLEGIVLNEVSVSTEGKILSDTTYVRSLVRLREAASGMVAARGWGEGSQRHWSKAQGFG